MLLMQCLCFAARTQRVAPVRQKMTVIPAPPHPVLTVTAHLHLILTHLVHLLHLSHHHLLQAIRKLARSKTEKRKAEKAR